MLRGALCRQALVAVRLPTMHAIEAHRQPIRDGCADETCAETDEQRGSG